MHDDLAGIDQHPIALGGAGDGSGAVSLLLEAARQMLKASRF